MVFWQVCVFVSLFFLPSAVDGGINFGSKDSTIKLSGSSKINITNGMTVSQGTFQKTTAADMIGQDVTFSAGNFIRDNASMVLSGNPNLDADGKLVLAGDDSFKADSGVVLQEIEVQGKNNKIEGTPSFLQSNGITLYDSSATMTLAIQSSLDKNVVLSGGGLYLGDDLSFSDDVKFSGAGSLNCNGYKLVLGGKSLTFTDTNYFVGNSNIAMNGPVSLRGIWVFDGACTINGNGYSLDLTNSSTLRLKSGATLHFSNVKLEGLGTGHISFDDNTARIRLSRSGMRLDGNYTFTWGGLYVDSACKIISSNKYLTFSNHSTLTIDGTTLYHDLLDYADNNNIRIEDTLNYYSLHGGGMRVLRAIPSGNYSYSEDITIGDSIILASNRYMNVTDNVTLNGSGFLLYCAPYDGTKRIRVTAGKTLTLQNVSVVNFDPNNIQLGAGSKIVFGDGVAMNLAESATIPVPMYFSGDSSIVGKGCALDLSTTGSLIVEGTGSTLSLDNVIIKGVAGTNVRCTDATNTINLKNAGYYMDAANTFTLGSFNLVDAVKLAGGKQFNCGTVSAAGNSALCLDNTSIWSGDVAFADQANIVMNSSVDLNGYWIFDGNSNLTGNGFVLDLSNGSTLRVKSGGTLHLSGVKIKGLGTGFIAFDDNTAGIRLSNSEIELDANYSLTQGGIYVDAGSAVISKNKYLTFALHSTMTVDGTNLAHEILNYADNDNIKFVTKAVNFCSVNGGAIKLYDSTPAGDYAGTSVGDLELDSNHRLNITSDTNMNLNGSVIDTSPNSDGLHQIVIGAGKTLLFRNALIRNFDPNIVSLGTGSKLVIGDGSTVRLSGSASLSYSLSFSGNSVFDGDGASMDLGTSGSLVVEGVGSSLTLENLVLGSVAGTNVRCLSPSSSISLKGVDYCMDAATTFSCGALNFINTVKFIGGRQFNYATGQTSTISANSALWLDENSIFYYVPPVATTRDLFAMTNTSSKLYVENATIKSSTAGMRFTKGTIIIEGFVDFDNSGARNYAQGFAFGNGTSSGDITMMLMREADANFRTGYVTFANVTRAIPYTR
jgi:hypothetical protein